MIDGVKQQKWWGWGEEGKAYRYEDKPKFPPFVMKMVGVDITAPVEPIPPFSSLEVPASRLSDTLRAELAGIIGEGFVQTDDETRVVHAFGKGVRDLLRVRSGLLGRIPDAVLYPGTQREVELLVDAAVAADAVLIPFGGGSNIVAALEAQPGETRQVLSVNLGRMSRVLEIDEVSGLAHIEAGVFGPDMEDQLKARGWTMGHHPDSFVWSTLGGWIATRSSGMQSDKYGDIADICRGLTMVMPGQVLTLRPLPSSSSGPSVREMVLGSEGRLGIITSAWVNVHRIPEVRELQAYFFATYEDGLRACQEIVESDASVMMARVSDAVETQYIMANGKKSSRLGSLSSKAIQRIMLQKGWDLEKIAMSFVGYEGSPTHVRYEKGLVAKIVRNHGGIGVGKGPGSLYDQKKYDTPYIRDFMLDRGLVADVSETTTPWAYVEQIHTNTVAAFHKAMAEIGVRGVVFCHLSHSYHSGACQYFTFAIADKSDNAMVTYDVAKRVLQQSFMDNHGTVSHHHGVGEEHSPWMDQDISPAGVSIQRALFDGVDPGHNLNPGKIIHEGRPGISTNSLDA
ncbi:FAD-binding oxidoreductase [Tessaracoccus sp. MC1679]|uniref:FAD-binding oxidoreductase n=1 Tax=unclassified Tessaracoccus TaxID=2635419 RepID=UPI0016018C7D|nr:MULTISPECIES: FAD-binding oxidoreductase [unclassified Tessaracoccus]MBB1511378.1 FAD-binding oxidoreductase [Tessaracoccus sp. MC1627]MBB1514919.1 FAD-binding oxidoreductase [Tessaracoccus sp. MC1679]